MSFSSIKREMRWRYSFGAHLLISTDHSSFTSSVVFTAIEIFMIESTQEESMLEQLHFDRDSCPLVGLGSSITRYFHVMSLLNADN